MSMGVYIKMDLREVGCNPGEWIDLAEDRVIFATSNLF